MKEHMSQCGIMKLAIMETIIETDSGIRSLISSINGATIFTTTMLLIILNGDGGNSIGETNGMNFTLEISTRMMVAIGK